MKKSAQDTQTAAKLLMGHLVCGNWNDQPLDEDFFSERTNENMLNLLNKLCTHFHIDMEKMAQFITTTPLCYYCTNDAIDLDRHGRNSCQSCLEEED